MRKHLLVLVLACFSVDTHADEASPNQGLLGDWGGLRTRLYQKGIDFQFGYVFELAYNAHGGARELTRYADQLTLGATFDLDKLWGWSNSKFQVTITDRNGNNLSADANLGTLQQVQEIFGRGQTWRWTQFWYDGVFVDGAVDLKLGRLGVGEDFMPFSCIFQNLSFCGSLPGNIVSTWFNWPVSQWATRVKVNLAPEWYFKVGVYQVNPSYLETKNAFRLNNPSGTIGALVPAELGWTPKLGQGGLPGSYRVGVWYDSSDQPDVFLAANNMPLVLSPFVPALTRNHEAGGYAMIQQQVTAVDGNPSRGLSLFANFVQADRHTATVDQLITLGLFYMGPLDARPRDELGFAVGRTHVNSRVADGQALRNDAGLGPVPVQGSEYPVELYYSISAASWMSLRPNIQYIHHPGGISQNSDVVVLGLKTEIKF